ncbi:MAG: formate dehydrogenase subunit gamma [Pseudomonadota bacterium]
MRFTRTVFLALLALSIALLTTLNATTADAQSSVRPPAGATTSETPGQPSGSGDALAPSQYDADFWNKVRGRTGAAPTTQGIPAEIAAGRGTVSIPDGKAAFLVDNSGWTWTALRQGQYATYGAYALIGMVLLLAVFFLIRGRVKIESGWSGSRISRFTDIERIGHWLLAGSFIVLAISGLNLIYGRDLVLPIIGKEAFASISVAMKLAHNYVAFAFMIGLALTFVLWVRNNIPHPRDLMWIAKGGGLFGGSHPPAKKFNAGQKIVFWMTMLSGFSLSLSGLALLFPYEFPMFAKTFEVLNVFGLGLPTELTPNQEQQFAATWHGALAIVMTALILAHIYIGSIGMQGAIDAMSSGEVDLNWAKEHHSLWVEEVLEEERREITGGKVQPAE